MHSLYCCSFRDDSLGTLGGELLLGGSDPAYYTEPLKFVSLYQKADQKELDWTFKIDRQVVK